MNPIPVYVECNEYGDLAHRLVADALYDQIREGLVIVHKFQKKEPGQEGPA